VCVRGERVWGARADAGLWRYCALRGGLGEAVGSQAQTIGSGDAVQKWPFFLYTFSAI
jgi:hypothetical protein